MIIPRNDMRQALQAYSGASTGVKKESEMRFCHIRNYDSVGNVLSKGGTTVAYINMGNGVYQFAVAKCHHDDIYNKKQGRAKAGGKLRSPKHVQIVDKITDLSDLIVFICSNRREL